MIPKKIYFTWISEKPVPQKFEKFIQSWKDIMPDYEIHQITLQNVKHGTFVDKAIAIKNYALAGHYARVEELYLNGGIYFDIDIEAVRSFDHLLDSKLVLGIESPYWINNAVIIAEKGHPYLKRCLEYMDATPFDKHKIELETGPRMFTNIMKEVGWKNGVTGKLNYKGSEVNILTAECFYPYYYNQNYTLDCIKPTTLCVHHWASTWNDMVSIIIPCYNQARFLPESIESALAQTYTNIEVIVVNDGSLDNASVVAKRYPSVKLVEQKNSGLSAARNAGIKAAAGGWIITLDADDKLHPDFIEKTIGKNDIVSTRLQTFGRENRTWKTKLANPGHKDLLNQNHINCCSLFKKDVWTMSGGYDEAMRDGYEDWEFWIRATGCGFQITSIDETLFFYRKHATHSMFDKAKANHNKIIKYMSEKYPANQFKKL